MYISPTVIVPAINGALTPPPLVIAISASTILLIVSATVAPIGLTPVSLLCGKSTDKSVTFSFIIGAKSDSNFASISSIFLSTGRVSFLLEISSSLVVTTSSFLSSNFKLTYPKFLPFLYACITGTPLTFPSTFW